MVPLKGHFRLMSLSPRIKYTYRHVSAFSISIFIGNHIEAHLVPSKVRVHRITVPFLIPFLLKTLHLDNPWWVGVASGRVLEPGTKGEGKMGDIRCSLEGCAECTQ